MKEYVTVILNDNQSMSTAPSYLHPTVTVTDRDQEE